MDGFAIGVFPGVDEQMNLQGIAAFMGSFGIRHYGRAPLQGQPKLVR